MSAELLSKILDKENNCAEAALYGLLYPLEPRVEFLSILETNNWHLELIALCAAIELFEQQSLFSFIYCLDGNESPSEKFDELFSEAAGDSYGARFIGGLIRQNLLIQDTGQIFGHVIAIPDIDPLKNLAVMVDTACFDEGSFPIKLTSLSQVDELVTRRDTDKYTRAIAMAGIPLSHPLAQEISNLENIKLTVANWRNELNLHLIKARQCQN